MTSFVVDWDASDFGPWHTLAPPITADKSREIADRLPTRWSPGFHQRLEVALKFFVDDAIAASAPRNPLRTIMRELANDPDLLSAILRDQLSGKGDDLARLAVRQYFECNAPTQTNQETDLAWAVHAVRWMEAEITKHANMATKSGRTSKQHLDIFMLALTEIALSCKSR